MKQLTSPNYDERAKDIALEYIVLHYTGMRDALEALSRLCDTAARVSAHYFVDEDGSVTQLVDESKRAWHAGKSFWRGITDINSASIGIEIVNPGHEFGYRAFPAVQIMAVRELMKDIITRRKMNAQKCLLAHSDIAPARKEDPGELFPWQLLATEGFGVWPEALPEDRGAINQEDVTRLLSEIGYDVTVPEKALEAFLRRFHPERLGNSADEESLARLKALRRALKG